MPSSHTRTITIDLDVANDLSQEALTQTRELGKKMTIRQIAEEAINQYIERMKAQRVTADSKPSTKKRG